MVTSRDYGKKVRVELKGTGEAVEGWLLEETPRGLYLSLDPDGKVIRLVQQDTVRVIFDIRDVGKAPFVPPDHEENAKKIEDLAKKIDRPVRDALDRLDHNRTKRLAVTIRDTLDQLEGYRFEESKRDIPGTELPPYGLFVSARNTHAEVLDEVRRSGLEDVLRANASSLRQVISRDTLPQMDSEAVPLAEVDEMIKLTREQDLLSETDFGRQWVYQPITINIQVGVPVNVIAPLHGGKLVQFNGVMQGTFWERDNGFISLASALSSQREEGSGRLLRHGIVPICRHGAITFTKGAAQEACRATSR